MEKMSWDEAMLTMNCLDLNDEDRELFEQARTVIHDKIDKLNTDYQNMRDEYMATIDKQGAEIIELRKFKDATLAIRDFSIDQEKENLMRKNSELFEQLKNVKHVLFETVIAPNCPTCSDSMGMKCDNGIMCMEKLLNGEFVRYDQIKNRQKLAEFDKCQDTCPIMDGGL